MDFTLWDIVRNLLMGLQWTAALSLVAFIGGGLIGLLIGHAFDSDWFKLSRDNPYRVFDLTGDASDAEVEQAYRRLISQYHPDKLAGAAPELRAQAEAKAREINTAYDRIRKLRKRQ